ncbi:hypothetical protein ABZ924_36845 [Streptomyces sp. NPDC046876]|uniref:hypothetical protein n=1 Tax=Streptomyces sp. NPDC046876 TaxID=3155616 RepID=UPI0033D7A129
MKRYFAPQEQALHPAAGPAAAADPAAAAGAAPRPRLHRDRARHRRAPRSRWLAAGLALASVLSATAITLTVDPAAPAPDAKPDHSSLQSAR